MSAADIAEVERMIETGAVDPDATRSAPVYMAERWLAEQVRKRERKVARAEEAPARRLHASRAAHERIVAISSRLAERAKHEWKDLLDASFALPSGERVTWRAATVGQHAERATMLEAHAAGNLESAALHRAAIGDIEAAGVDTLWAIS